MASAGRGSPGIGGVITNSITGISNTPIEIPSSSDSDAWVIHVDNEDNGDDTYIKLWSKATVTYSTDEPDIKIKVPAGAVGEIEVGYLSAFSNSQIDGSAKWWIAASSSAALDGGAPTNTVDVEITRTE